jgi:hypothetical protein
LQPLPPPRFRLRCLQAAATTAVTFFGSGGRRRRRCCASASTASKLPPPLPSLCFYCRWCWAHAPLYAAAPATSGDGDPQRRRRGHLSNPRRCHRCRCHCHCCRRRRRSRRCSSFLCWCLHRPRLRTARAANLRWRPTSHCRGASSTAAATAAAASEVAAPGKPPGSVLPLRHSSSLPSLSRRKRCCARAVSWRSVVLRRLVGTRILFVQICHAQLKTQLLRPATTIASARHRQRLPR